jgi:hypothetical protein
MGASGWRYVVPHDPDLGSVLELLRRQVFKDRDYYYLPDDHEWPDTMAELFADESVQQEGTHSILDIFRVIGSDEDDDYGTLRSLRRDEVVRHFGSETPDRAAFDRAHDSTAPDGLLLSGRRWSGYCTTLYEADVPAEMVTWGFSGD